MGEIVADQLRRGGGYAVSMSTFGQSDRLAVAIQRPPEILDILVRFARTTESTESAPMPGWIDIAPLTDFDEAPRQCAQIGSMGIVVFRIDESFYAIENTCPHAGMPLADGELRGRILTCPFHGYTYNIDTGKNIDFPDIEPPVKTFNVRVRNGRVEIELDEDQSDAANNNR